MKRRDRKQTWDKTVLVKEWAAKQDATRALSDRDDVPGDADEARREHEADLADAALSPTVEMTAAELAALQTDYARLRAESDALVAGVFGEWPRCEEYAESARNTTGHCDPPF